MTSRCLGNTILQLRCMSMLRVLALKGPTLRNLFLRGIFPCTPAGAILLDMQILTPLIFMKRTGFVLECPTIIHRLIITLLVEAISQPTTKTAVLPILRMGMEHPATTIIRLLFLLPIRPPTLLLLLTLLRTLIKSWIMTMPFQPIHQRK